MLRNLLDRIFKSPPVGERLDIRHSFIKKIACPTPSVSDKDDTYIYYQAVRSSFAVTVPLAVFFLLFYTFGAEYFVVHPPHTNVLPAMLERYAEICRFILLYFLFPFFIVKFRWNINPKAYDVLWFSPTFPPTKKRPRGKILLWSGFMLLVLSWGTFRIEVLPYAPYASVFYGENIFSMALYLGVLAYFLSACVMLMLIALVAFYRYILTGDRG